MKAGSFIPVYADTQLLSYIREAQGATRFLIVLNLSHRPCYFKPTTQAFKGTIVVCTSSALEGQQVSGVIVLEADEGIIVKLE